MENQYYFRLVPFSSSRFYQWFFFDFDRESMQRKHDKKDIFIVTRHSFLILPTIWEGLCSSDRLANKSLARQYLF